MADYAHLAAFVLTLVALAALWVRRARATTPGIEIPEIEREDLDALAARLVAAVKSATGAEAVALRRVTFDGVTEIAAVGPDISVRPMWIEEVEASKRAVAIGRIQLVPILDAGEVISTLVIDGPLDGAKCAQVAALVEQARPLLREAVRKTNRSTQRLLALAKSSDLDQVFEAIADGLAVTDDRGELVRVNAAGRAILDAANRGTCNPLLEALREGMPTDAVEVAFGSGDDGRVVQLKVSKLSSAPESRAVVAILRDITQARTLEHRLHTEIAARARYVEELEAKQRELEAATRHKSEFLANMSHELRTPLNGIIGFAEILLEGTYGRLNAKQAECARDVLDGGRHLLALINDILDVAKIEAGRIELTPEDVALDTVVNAALTLVRPEAAHKELKVSVEVDAGLTVHGDSDRIRQILLNLLSNAVKFTPARGSVSLRAYANETTVRVTVADTGVGIAEKDWGKLFKEFSQVDGSITRKFGGTGLGLAICKRLVELHGGTIGFDSRLGEGSTFWFELPRGKRAERPPFAVKSPLRSSSVPRLKAVVERPALIVDAHGPSRRIVENALADAGIASAACQTLADARAAVSLAAPSAIVIDPELPDATECEAIEFAVATAGSSVVITSAQSRSSLAVPDGVGFVQKPLDRSQLVDEVSRALGREGRRARFALVIDDEHDGSAVTALLQREGMRTELAPTLAAARKILERSTPDVVVLELDLPDGDGVDLLRTLAGRRRAITVVLTNREIDSEDEVYRLATIVTRKGELSRTAFVRRLEAALQPDARAHATILAVDDNDQNLRLITALLGARGYDVIEARDATSAIDFARAERPDLILMDVMLPGLDGLTATRMLAEDPRTRGIPVIAISANAMPEDHAKARAAGCCAYVTKPIDVRTLLDAVATALRTDPKKSTRDSRAQEEASWTSSPL